MLEYTLAFLNMVSEVLLVGDLQKERIRFLLVPSRVVTSGKVVLSGGVAS